MFCVKLNIILVFLYSFSFHTKQINVVRKTKFMLNMANACLMSNKYGICEQYSEYPFKFKLTFLSGMYFWNKLNCCSTKAFVLARKTTRPK